MNLGRPKARLIISSSERKRLEASTQDGSGSGDTIPNRTLVWFGNAEHRRGREIGRVEADGGQVAPTLHRSSPRRVVG